MSFGGQYVISDRLDAGGPNQGYIRKSSSTTAVSYPLNGFLLKEEFSCTYYNYFTCTHAPSYMIKLCAEKESIRAP